MFSKVRYDGFRWCFSPACFWPCLINTLEEQLQQDSLGWDGVEQVVVTEQLNTCTSALLSHLLLWFDLSDLCWLLCWKIHAKRSVCPQLAPYCIFRQLRTYLCALSWSFGMKLYRWECHWALRSLYLVFLCYFSWPRSSSLPAAGCSVVHLAIVRCLSDPHRVGWFPSLQTSGFLWHNSYPRYYCSSACVLLEPHSFSSFSLCTALVDNCPWLIGCDRQDEV